MPVPTAQRIRFGAFELDRQSGELYKQGAKLKLHGQPIAVLSLLLDHPGELVTREEIRKHLWPDDTFVDFEHSLNTHIKKLRQVFDDDAETPRYIETLPRRGYRFIAQVEAADSTRSKAPAPEPEPSPPPLPKHRWRYVLATLMVCALIGGLLYPFAAPSIARLIRLYRQQQLTVVPLTALPGNVASPTFSPDGSQIAFAWDGGNSSQGSDVYVKVIGSDKPLRLTSHGNAFAPAWSPDGKTIAFRRDNSSDPGIFLISPLGGPEHKITSAICYCFEGSQMSWSPDGKRLAFLNHPADSPSDYTVRLFLLSLDSMETAPVKTDCNLVTSPAFSHGGDYLAWACADSEDNVSIQVQRLSDGSITQLLRGIDGVGGMVWSQDGRRIIFTSSYTGGDLWEIALNRPNHPEKLPFGYDASYLAVNFPSHRLAYAQERRNVNVWRVGLFEPQPHPQKIVTSSREQTAPKYSPDGSQIAFESNRSGSNEVWVSDADGANAVQLSSFGKSSTGTPRWSPDGKLIAFDSRVGGEANIYIVDPHGGVPKKLDIDIHGNCLPAWSHDGKWIYFVNGKDAHNSTVWKVPSGGGHAVLIAQRPASIPIESPDAQYLYFVRHNQLWSVKIDGSDAHQVADPGFSGTDSWVPFGSGIYFLGSANKKLMIKFLDFDTKEVRPVSVLDKDRPGWMGGLSISSDGRWLLFSQLDEQSSDLMLLENWQ